MLKVLKLETAAGAKGERNARGVAAPSTLTMNQTLEGHKGACAAVHHGGARACTASMGYAPAELMVV